jgi:hypothetical protein
MIELDEFKLQRAVLEIRYDPAFLLWDRAGSIGNELHQLFPNLAVKGAAPNQQTLKLDEGTQVGIEFEKGSLTTFFPPNNLQEFRENCGKVFPVIIDSLARPSLTRIGFRIFYEKLFPTKREASEFVLQYLPSFRRSGKHFNIEGAVFEPRATIRWEGETIGSLVTLQAIEAKLELDMPLEWGGLEAINARKAYAQLDVDMYAHSSTSTSKFNAPAVVENWYKLIRRDIGSFLNG